MGVGWLMRKMAGCSGNLTVRSWQSAVSSLVVEIGRLVGKLAEVGGNIAEFAVSSTQSAVGWWGLADGLGRWQDIVGI